MRTINIIHKFEYKVYKNSRLFKFQFCYSIFTCRKIYSTLIQKSLSLIIHVLQKVVHNWFHCYLTCLRINVFLNYFVYLILTYKHTSCKTFWSEKHDLINIFEWMVCTFLYTRTGKTISPIKQIWFVMSPIDSINIFRVSKIEQVPK